MICCKGFNGSRDFENRDLKSWDLLRAILEKSGFESRDFKESWDLRVGESQDFFFLSKSGI